jgi:hypothetical protein
MPGSQKANNRGLRSEFGRQAGDRRLAQEGGFSEVGQRTCGLMAGDVPHRSNLQFSL